MRRILFGTFHLDGYTHLLELAHMHEYPRDLGIVDAHVTAHDEEGNLVLESPLDIREAVQPLGDLLPKGHRQLLVGIDVGYCIDRCELIYGYLDLPGTATSGVYYPINFTKGLRDRRSYLNCGTFAFGPLPPVVQPVLFMGNFAEFAAVSGRLRIHYGPHTRRHEVALRPRRMNFLPIDREWDGWPLGHLDFVGTARVATYMMGMGPNGGFMFFEHLMQPAR
jgi:hypothetical protein